MIHSYGFLEEDIASAKVLFLDLDIPDDDPLKQAKKAICDSAPGVRLTKCRDEIRWESDFVLLACVNEEDGLLFQVEQTIDGEQRIMATFDEQEIISISKLSEALRESSMWEVYHLRAVALIQNRIEDQLGILYTRGSGADDASSSAEVREAPKKLATKLRALEMELLDHAYEYLEEEVCGHLPNHCLTSLKDA